MGKLTEAIQEKKNYKYREGNTLIRPLIEVYLVMYLNLFLSDSLKFACMIRIEAHIKEKSIF